MMGWGLAVFLSLGLNLFLFGIMPNLIQGVPQGAEPLEDLHPLEVVRVKPKERLTPKQKNLQPPKPRQEKVKQTPATGLKTLVPAMVKPRLPFELNSRLPEISSPLEMPPLSHVSMTAPMPQGPFLAGDLDLPLTAVAKIPPVYPLRATRMGIEGWVKIQFVVTPKGRVRDVTILEADPKGIFETAVINCASKWRFIPGTVKGEAVAVQARTIIRFQLEK
ncbi:MAG: TonB family protein [Desulfobacter sp.]|nr:TonB family protein [Desulfobacter sp.]